MPDTSLPQLYAWAKNFSEAYSAVMRPVGEVLQMPQTAVDILMFFANNPEYSTARDVCKFRSLKPGIVSVQIDRLVNEGYLLRRDIPGDRRKCSLVCTKKSEPVVLLGRELQKKFTEGMTKGLNPEEIELLARCFMIFEKNFEEMKRKK